MKYHSIPSIGKLSAYKEGRLAIADQQRIEELMEQNPMVAAVVADLDPKDAGLVADIAGRVQDSVVYPRIRKMGFWSRYAGWMGFSSIVLILGVYGILQWSKPEPRYSTQALLITSSSIDVDAEVNLSTNEADTPASTHERVTTDEIIREIENVEGAITEGQYEKINLEASSSIENHKQLENSKIQKESLSGVPKQTGLVEKEKGEDNTRTFNTKNTENATTLLALSNVQILSKMNPDALKTRSTGGNGNPLGEQTTSSSRSFSVSDIPTYPGGDRALQNYFKGALRPIEIPKEQDHFDRSVLLELTVSARGKIKDYKIMGQLHPAHQNALKDAVDNLSRFNKGSEKITYSLGLSF